MKPALIIIVILAALGIGAVVAFRSPGSALVPTDGVTATPNPTPAVRRVDFSNIDATFRFSAEVPNDWEPTYVAAIDAIDLAGQIFIRNFTASDFLTLSTVNILSREPTMVNGHAAVRYEIEKKPGVPDFPNQPPWRNSRHKLIDIRLAPSGTTSFYVFAYNPELEAKVFETFIASLIFHNDRQSFVVPMSRAGDRVTKKPFGIYITPPSSPVQPERFTGYHTGTDFEIFSGEERSDISVAAICGGTLLSVDTASGYGGIARQECLLNDQPVSVVYGHIQLLELAHGQYLAPGHAFAVLGDGFSSETDGERKHLHLAVRKGATSDIRGYVQTRAELDSWIDPAGVIL